METIKPTVFIGSSTPGYSIAEKVKQQLSETCECSVWQDENTWQPNLSTFDNLLQMASFFDFGVFVATADDLTLKRDQIVIEPRDNVILEMALFLGAMGRHKSFLLVEEGIDLPSDFSGIYMPRFNRNDDESIKKACKAYLNHILEYYKQGHLSFYPTTALAIGYYNNFVSLVVEGIKNVDVLEFEGVKYSTFKLRIVIPKNLEGSIKEKGEYYYKQLGLIENTIKTPYRKHPAWFQLDPQQAPKAIMYDMPSTLAGIDDAIELILRKDFFGRSKLQQVLEQRELNNFKRVLHLKIQANPFAKGIVEIIDEP